MSVELVQALEMLEKERGLNKEILVEAIKSALLAAYKKNFHGSGSAEVYFDEETGEIEVYTVMTIVEEVEDETEQMALSEALEIDEAAEAGDIVRIEVTPKDFGRIAAQTAKQIVMQKIKEAEKDIVFEEYFRKENDIITGVIQKEDRRNVIVDIGKVEAALSQSEQTPGEKYIYNTRMKFYVNEVKNGTKGLHVYLSRTNPDLVKRLFELEIPEIKDGVIEIKSIAREPGIRTKIAVFSNDDNVEPIGSCIGQRGIRVQSIVEELRGEKIDIVKWSSNVVEYVERALSPAKVISVTVNEEEKAVKVVVPDDQLSLAIGKNAQNVRLAVKLTGWKIDIKTESELREFIENQLFTDIVDNSETETEAEVVEEEEIVEDTVEETEDLVEEVVEEVEEE